MISKSTVGAALVCILSVTSLAYAGGWLEGTLAGDLLEQGAILLLAAAADRLLPGAGRFVIEALEAFWTVR